MGPVVATFYLTNFLATDRDPPEDAYIIDLDVLGIDVAWMWKDRKNNKTDILTSESSSINPETMTIWSIEGGIC